MFTKVVEKCGLSESRIVFEFYQTWCGLKILSRVNVWCHEACRMMLNSKNISICSHLSYLYLSIWIDKSIPLDQYLASLSKASFMQTLTLGQIFLCKPHIRERLKICLSILIITSSVTVYTVGRCQSWPCTLLVDVDVYHYVRCTSQTFAQMLQDES